MRNLFRNLFEMQSNTLQVLHIVYQKYIDAERKRFVEAAKEWNSLTIEGSPCDHAKICELGCIRCDRFYCKKCYTKKECWGCEYSERCGFCGSCLGPSNSLCREMNETMAKRLEPARVRPTFRLGALAIVLGQKQPFEVTRWYHIRGQGPETFNRSMICAIMMKRQCHLCNMFLCEECTAEECDWCTGLICKYCTHYRRKQRKPLCTDCFEENSWTGY